MCKFLKYLLLFGLLFSCSEVIEVKDISNDLVVILAPVNNSVLQTSTVNFSWEALDFAETYKLQIAKPDFETAQTIVEDTIVSVTEFSKTLEASSYQWRIKAINSAYETAYSTQNLSIED